MKNLNLLKKVATVAAVSTVAVMATTGKASAIEIQLGNNPPPFGFEVAPSYNYSQGGISLTATASAPSAPSTSPVNVFRNKFGLGVFIGDGADANEVDGLNFGETLNLTFSPQVRLVRAIFAAVDDPVDNPDGDEYSISVDSSFLQSGNLSTIGTGIVSVAISNSPFGALYSFTVTDGNDDYFLKAVEVEPVPEPITMAGLALGSGFGVLLRKKYKKSASVSNQLSS